MSDEPENPEGAERAVTTKEPSGGAHVATRSVVLDIPRKKIVKPIGIQGRMIHTRPWKRKKPRARPPSIGSMQPPGKK